ncbi:HlyD family efflux transporter periplasmic adaptor subunit [Flavivirga aquimarina]|uniref:HlyD family efflux transporter periplasmic adaptor subunit n=1 Tax=Flavivirga aquimarina TaxID=2027862 RepID=A0ABT8WA97_9FLAO|nr:HlyD family efflux transporter periplasmic adaptor subunit [Flavivirga aquimarina]MDO5970071.1 HlyD family efflux transporter periplasmic adaptor subunit [Flavivirga aquimarina]
MSNRFSILFFPKGDILAVIENNADFNDIKLIKKYLKTFTLELKDFDSLDIKLPPKLDLGDVQTSYNNFRLRYQDYLNYLVLTPEKKRIDNYTFQMLSKSESLKDHTKRLEQYQVQLDNEKKKYLNNQKLYKRGIISELDYINSQNALSKAKEKYQELKSNLEYEKSNLLVAQNNLKQSSIKDKSLLLSSSQNLMQSRQELINDIKSWEQKYVLSSPIDGKFTLFDVWNQYQDINVNDVVFTIIPNDLNGIVGRVLVPITNSRKLKRGQDVLIKIENSPYQEWGKLRGTVSSISSIPLCNILPLLS